MIPPERSDPARREPVTDFVTLFHVASDFRIPWPSEVEAWGDKAPANRHLLKRIRAEVDHPAPGSSTLMLRLIDELLKAVNG